MDSRQNQPLQTDDGRQTGVLNHPASTANPSVSVVVPVYNSEASLPELVKRLKPVLASLTADYELVLVNDGSRDGSWEMIQKLCAQNDWLRGIELMRNY